MSLRGCSTQRPSDIRPDPACLQLHAAVLNPAEFQVRRLVVVVVAVAARPRQPPTKLIVYLCVYGVPGTRKAQAQTQAGVLRDDGSFPPMLRSSATVGAISQRTGQQRHSWVGAPGTCTWHSAASASQPHHGHFGECCGFDVMQPSDKSYYVSYCGVYLFLI